MMEGKMPPRLSHASRLVIQFSLAQECISVSLVSRIGQIALWVCRQLRTHVSERLMGPQLDEPLAILPAHQARARRHTMDDRGLEIHMRLKPGPATPTKTVEVLKRHDVFARMHAKKRLAERLKDLTPNGTSRPPKGIDRNHPLQRIKVLQGPAHIVRFAAFLAIVMEDRRLKRDGPEIDQRGDQRELMIKHADQKVRREHEIITQNTDPLILWPQLLHELIDGIRNPEALLPREMTPPRALEAHEGFTKPRPPREVRTEHANQARRVARRSRRRTQRVQFREEGVDLRGQGRLPRGEVVVQPR